MGLPKGRTNNPNGRTPDEKVKAYREAVRGKQIDRIENLYVQLDTLEGKEYIEMYLRINKDIFPSLPTEVEEGEIERSVNSIFDKVTELISKAETKPPPPNKLKKTG